MLNLIYPTQRLAIALYQLTQPASPITQIIWESHKESGRATFSIAPPTYIDIRIDYLVTSIAAILLQH